jgi:hypothetical protein
VILRWLTLLAELRRGNTTGTETSQLTRKDLLLTVIVNTGFPDPSHSLNIMADLEPNTIFSVKGLVAVITGGGTGW